jgi:hypothetical protein
MDERSEIDYEAGIREERKVMIFGRGWEREERSASPYHYVYPRFFTLLNHDKNSYSRHEMIFNTPSFRQGECLL